DLLRVSEPERDHALHDQLLEVAAAHVEQERELLIAERHFRDGGPVRREPEREARRAADDAASAIAQDVGGGFRSQMTNQWICLDLGHPRPPFWLTAYNYGCIIGTWTKRCQDHVRGRPRTPRDTP